MGYNIGQVIADMHGTSIHHIGCIKEVVSVSKFGLPNASEVMLSMLPPREPPRSFAENKALYIIAEKSAKGQQAFIVAWAYDGVTLGVAHVILVD